MEIQIYPLLKCPDGNVVIWRYLDFAKFTHMLSTSTLYFNRIDNFRDTFEGTLPENFWSPNVRPDRSIAQQMARSVEENRKRTYINCWHINDYESAAMWDLYKRNGDGIAIKSTVHRLRYCVTDNRRLIIGEVEYLDYNAQIDGKGGIFAKRKSFEHEKELRVSYQHARNDVSGELGLLFDIDLSILVEHIYVSPESPPWIFELVKIITAKYSLDVEIIHSKLYEII